MFEVGDNVKSIHFGNGVVTCVSGGEDFPLSVKFEKHEEEENFTIHGGYFKYGVEHPRNIKKVDTALKATNFKKTLVTGFGYLIEFDNGICIYQPNQGQPFQVYPKQNIEGLS